MNILEHVRVEPLLYAAVVAAAFWTVSTTGVEITARFVQLRGAIPGLQKGWIGHRYVDLSDPQWQQFREGMVQLTFALLFYVLGSQTVQRLWPHYRRYYCLTFSLFFIGFLHGGYTLHLIGLALANYALARFCATKPYGAAVLWVANCGMLCLVRVTDGFPFPVSEYCQPQLSYDVDWAVGAWRKLLAGSLRWHITYNLSVLRFISYGMDLRWATQHSYSGDSEDATTTTKRSPRDPNSTVKRRSAVALDVSLYSLVDYLCFVFYPPLFLAGPISTFNNFSSQIHSPQKIPTFQLVKHGVWLVFVWFLQELLTHSMYVNSISKFQLWKKLGRESPLRFGALEFSVVGFWMLIFIWLKFLVIWRFFRFWSLLDGIEPPENMCQCVCNNYDNEGFWRSWHASFNLWLVRYLYVPLGGQNKRWANVWVIFLFVGLWHDLELRMLQWAWIIAGFFFLEMAVKQSGLHFFSKEFRKSHSYRHLSAACGACNIFLLMTANMIGFGVGFKNAKTFLVGILQQPMFVSGMYLTFFAAVQLMFAMRWSENAELNMAHTKGLSDTLRS